MQGSPFASFPDDFIHISHIRYAYLFRKPLRGLCRWGHLHTVRVCKGPPLHHLPMIIFISLISGMLTFLESLYEACADGDICTPVSLHYAAPALTLLPISSKLDSLESIYEACKGMQRSPFASFPDDFIHISYIRYAYLFRKPLRGLCR
jgi:hypothetical protein